MVQANCSICNCYGARSGLTRPLAPTGGRTPAASQRSTLSPQPSLAHKLDRKKNRIGHVSYKAASVLVLEEEEEGVRAEPKPKTIT